MFHQQLYYKKFLQTCNSLSALPMQTDLLRPGPSVSHFKASAMPCSICIQYSSQRRFLPGLHGNAPPLPGRGGASVCYRIAPNFLKRDTISRTVTRCRCQVDHQVVVLRIAIFLKANQILDGFYMSPGQVPDMDIITNADAIASWPIPPVIQNGQFSQGVSTAASSWVACSAGC